MVSVEIQLHNPSGLHLRPAGILCKAATKFQSHVAIRTADGTEVNAKSVLSVLSACIKTGALAEKSFPVKHVLYGNDKSREKNLFPAHLLKLSESLLNDLP